MEHGGLGSFSHEFCCTPPYLSHAFSPLSPDKDFLWAFSFMLQNREPSLANSHTDWQRVPVKGVSLYSSARFVQQIDSGPVVPQESERPLAEKWCQLCNNHSPASRWCSALNSLWVLWLVNRPLCTFIYRPELNCFVWCLQRSWLLLPMGTLVEMNTALVILFVSDNWLVSTCSALREDVFGFWFHTAKNHGTISNTDTSRALHLMPNICTNGHQWASNAKLAGRKIMKM